MVNDYLNLNELLQILPSTIESHTTDAQFQNVMPMPRANKALSDIIVRIGPIPMRIMARMIRAIIPNVFMCVPLS